MSNEHRHPEPVPGFSQRVEDAWPLTLALSPRAIGTERGCVEDQPQRVGSSKTSAACGVLRLVEDDTAALRYFPLACFETGFRTFSKTGCEVCLPACCSTM